VSAFFQARVIAIWWQWAECGAGKKIIFSYIRRLKNTAPMKRESQRVNTFLYFMEQVESYSEFGTEPSVP
jgi:hypothetical protein